MELIIELFSDYKFSIGFTIAIISIVIALVSYNKSKRYSRARSISLGYRCIFKLEKKSLPDKLKVTFGGMEYENIAQYKCILLNSGDTPVVRDDVWGKVLVKSSVPIKILEITAGDLEDSDINISVISPSVTDKNAILEIQFDHISPKSKYYFSFICSEDLQKPELKLHLIYKNQTKADKIISVNNLFEPVKSPGDPTGAYLFYVAIYLVATYYSFVFTQKLTFDLISNALNFSKVAAEEISFFLGLIPPILILAFVVYLIRKQIKKWENKDSENNSENKNKINNYLL